MDRQKVVHFARSRRPPDAGGTRTSPMSLRRPRAATSMDRARVAPLASIEPDSFGAPRREFIKGGSVPSQEPSQRGDVSTNGSGLRLPRQHSQPGSSSPGVDLTRARFSPAAGGRHESNPADGGADLQQDDYDFPGQPTQEPARHYSFTSVPESWKQCESRSNVRWIQSLNRARPSKMKPPAGHPQSSPSRSSPSSGTTRSTEKGKATETSVPFSETRTSVKTHDSPEGPIRNVSNEVSRDVVRNSSFETRTVQNKTNSSFVKETTVKKETQLVSKTVIRQSSFSSQSVDNATHCNSSLAEGSPSQRPEYRYAKLAYQSHSLDRAQNPHVSRPVPTASRLPEMKDPLISPEDLLKSDSFTRYMDAPSSPPRFHHEVSARRRNYIPASKPAPRKLSREQGLSLARDIAKSCVANADKPPVSWKPSSPHRGRACVQEKKSFSYKTSPISQTKTLTDNPSSSDTSFDSCSSGSYNNSKCAMISDRPKDVPAQHPASAQANTKSAPKPPADLKTPQSPSLQPSGSPDWKRNSMRLATMGYTSMSDLTKSLDCLNLVTEADGATVPPSDVDRHAPSRQDPYPKQVYRDSGTAMSKCEFGSQVSESPKSDSQRSNIYEGNTASETRSPTSRPHSHRSSFDSDDKARDIQRGSSFNDKDFRLQRETNSIIYTPTVNATLKKNAPCDQKSPSLTPHFTKTPLNPKSNHESLNYGSSNSRQAQEDPRNCRHSKPGPTVKAPSNSINSRATHDSKESLTSVDDERNNTIKRRSMRLATASISDLTVAPDDLDTPSLSQTSGRLEDSVPKTRDISYQDESSMFNRSPQSDIFYTPNLQRRGSRGAGLSGSSPNSSYGSFYSCQSQSLSANSSPMVGRFRDPQFSPLDSSRKSHYNNESFCHSDKSFITANSTRSTSTSISAVSNSNQNKKMSEPLKIGRPLPRQNRNQHGFHKESSVSPPQSLSLNTTPTLGNRRSPMQPRNSKERHAREYQDLSSLLCHSSKSPTKNNTIPGRSFNKTPTQAVDTTPTSRAPARSAQLAKQPYSNSPQHGRGGSGHRDVTSPLTSSPKSEEISSSVSNEPRLSVYDNMDSDADLPDDSSFSDDTYDELESEDDVEHWVAGMPRSPPSLGRPRRKVYAGFDSQPLPMDAFFSDSSSMYTINTSCSSRTPSRSAEASHRGSDWSIEAGKNLRPSSSLTYDSNRTTPTKSMFESDISINSARSSRMGKTDTFNDFTSEETLVDSARRGERGMSGEKDTQYDNADAFINIGGSKSYPNLKQHRSRTDMVLPLKLNSLDPDLTPTATPVDEKQNRELGQLFNVPREMTSPAREPSGSQVSTPVNGGADRKGPGLSASKSATCRPRAKVSTLSRTPKAFSSRDIFDLFLTSSDRKHHDSAATLTSLEKRAHKVCRAILCCNERDNRPGIVGKEYLL